MEHHISHRSLIGFFFSLSLYCSNTTVAILTKNKSSIPAIFIFGDSTVDPGNNNYLATLFKSNFPPYGKNYPFHKPTGRFTDGKLVTDFISSYVGLKETVPPYLDPTLSTAELLTGVSFASAATGFDPFTVQLSGVISMPGQLEYFKEYKEKLNNLIGKEEANNLVRKSAYLISCGTNDFAVNYFNVPIQRHKYSIEQYQLFVFNHFTQFLQDLMTLGARKVAVVGLPPFGCLPAVITASLTGNYFGRRCVEPYNAVAREFNYKIQHYLENIKLPEGMDGGWLKYGDIYKPLEDIIQKPHQYGKGFEEWRYGCCGTGLLEAAVLCNKDSYVCEDASKYVFWDAIHPTQKAYFLLFASLRSSIDAGLSLG